MQPVTEDMLQDQEVTIMKLRAISIAIVMAGFAGVVAAGQPGGIFQTTIISGDTITECAPPNHTSGQACDGLNQLVRANFTSREIDILFGTRTFPPEYGTRRHERLMRRYLAVVQQYVAQQNAANQPIAGK